MSLPSYQQAVKGPDVWSLISTQVFQPDLYSLVLVSKGLKATFTPLMWNHPIKLVSSLSRPFSRAICFIHVAVKARKETRDMVLHLDYRPLLSLRSQLFPDYVKNEHHIYVDLVIQRLTYFKNLRFVILDDFNKTDAIAADPEFPKGRHTPHIMLFSANCSNQLESSTILHSPCLRSVMYLDLSYTKRQDGWTRLFSAAQFSNLRVLKLRGLRLTDSQLPSCVLSSNCKIWSLDLRDNFLTSPTIDRILKHNSRSSIDRSSSFGRFKIDDDALYEDPPNYRAVMQRETTSDNITLRRDDQDGFAHHLETYGDFTANKHHPLHTGQEEIYPDPYIQRTGLTHLYLSGNWLDSYMVPAILSSPNRLQVVNLGSLPTIYPQIKIQRGTLCGQPELVTYLHRLSGSRLEKLTMHHSIITRTPSIIVDKDIPSFTLSTLHQCEELAEPASTGFNPLDNYRIADITLTDVPTKSFGPIIETLLTCLNRCAEQEVLLTAAKAATQNHRRAPELLTGVRRLRLELVGEATTTESTSVTGDKDADAFLAESAGDFSFFGGAGGEVERSKTSLRDDEGPKGARDVIEELKAWRSTKAGQTWSGKLELKKPPKWRIDSR